MIHVSPDYPTIIGKDTTIGHGAVINGATIGDNCIIGINSTVLDGAVIGDECLVAANAVVTPRTVVPPRSVVMGVPGRVVRTNDVTRPGVCAAFLCQLSGIAGRAHQREA